MPQLSLYIDKETLERIELAARKEHLSLSKFVVSRVRESLDRRWAPTVTDLFGSITDPSFRVEPTAGADIDRESL